MWQWSFFKSILLGMVAVLILYLAGLPTKGSLVIGVAFTVFAHWIIEEINFIRNTHGSDIEDLEDKIEDLNKRIK